MEQSLAGARDGVFAVGPDGRVSLWNRAAERILGWTAREMLEKPCGGMLRGVGAEGNRLCRQGCHVMSWMKRGEAVQHFEMETRTKGGQPIWLDIRFLERRSARGGRSTTVHLFRDVTATRRLLELVRERLAPSTSAPGKGVSLLTRREGEILRLMAAGANTKALAERLHVSPATIRNHAQNIFAKLQVHSRLEAVAWANQNRLV